MLSKIFSIHDAKANAFLSPFFAVTPGLAERSVIDSVNDPQHPFARYTADYTLFEIGEYDDATGIITPLPAPHVVANLVQYKQQPPQQ